VKKHQDIAQKNKEADEVAVSNSRVSFPEVISKMHITLNGQPKRIKETMMEGFCNISFLMKQLR
jgi:hypothetical protein